MIPEKKKKNFSFISKKNVYKKKKDTKYERENRQIKN